MLSYDFFFFSSRRRHTRCGRDWSSDVCSSDLPAIAFLGGRGAARDIRGRRAARVGSGDAGPRGGAARLGVPRWRAAGTRWDGWLPERAVGPHGSAARLGAGDSGATPRRLGENLAGGASALRLGALCDERGDQRPTDPGATAALRGAGASARASAAVRRRSSLGWEAEATTLRG